MKVIIVTVDSKVQEAEVITSRALQELLNVLTKVTVLDMPLPGK